MNKNILRESMKNARRELTDDFIRTASEKITQTVFNTDALKNASVVLVYMSAFREPDTIELTDKLLSAGKCVCVPVSDTDSCTFIPSRITSLNGLRKGAYGIPEPPVIVPVGISDIDTALIPGIVFDRNGNRIGFGKGYYDRFLSEFHGKKIGISYDFQVLETVPAGTHDIKMDLIITEKRIYNDF